MSSGFHRRTFLTRAGTLALGPALAAGASVEPAPPAIRLGFSLYGMRSLSLDAALEACAAIGYDAVELAALPGWPADPALLKPEQRPRLRDQLRQHKLTLAAVMENTPLDGEEKAHQAQLERLKAAAELGHELSPEAPPVLETILGGKVDQWDRLKATVARRCADWARLAEKTQTVIAVKPHRFQALNTPEQALWLMEQVKSRWLRLAYDYSHFEHRDMPLADTLKALLPYTAFIHVKDTRKEQGKVQFVLPGEGTIDYAALFKQAAALGYRGCICVEVSGQVHTQKGYDPLATARRCYDKLSAAFEKAGVRRVPRG
jgi:inosose dehydratase